MPQNPQYLIHALLDLGVYPKATGYYIDTDEVSVIHEFIHYSKMYYPRTIMVGTATVSVSHIF